jgi:hypothetical protein
MPIYALGAHEPRIHARSGRRSRSATRRTTRSPLDRSPVSPNARMSGARSASRSPRPDWRTATPTAALSSRRCRCAATTRRPPGRTRWGHSELGGLRAFGTTAHRRTGAAGHPGHPRRGTGMTISVRRCTSLRAASHDGLSGVYGEVAPPEVGPQAVGRAAARRHAGSRSSSHDRQPVWVDDPSRFGERQGQSGAPRRCDRAWSEGGHRIRIPPQASAVRMCWLSGVTSAPVLSLRLAPASGALPLAGQLIHERGHRVPVPR